MVSILTCPSNSYFNPRSREGSDNSVKPFVIRIDSISIHAPARGATLFRNVMQLETQISIHAPVRGATVKELCEIVWGEFQSTLPRGERRVFLCHVTDNRSISIHAPASGATLEVVEVVRRRVFQSTLPRVERRATSTWSCCRRVFQSTLPRVERRGKIYVVCSRGAISIHAPASGATVIFPLSSCSVTFQSTLPRVERRRRRTQTKRLYRFQSTLPRVERPAALIKTGTPSHFNPRSREWSDGRSF